LLKDELDEFAKANSRFKLVNVVGQSADDMPMGWDGETGWIGERGWWEGGRQAG
jgi:hypothetical protein